MSHFASATDLLKRRPVGCVDILPTGRPVVGSCEVPGSKSASMRALLLAGFAHGSSQLTGLLESADTFWGCDALGRLGVRLRRASERHGAIIVDGCGGSPPRTRASLHLGDAGTLARFLPGLLAAASTGGWHLTGSEQLEKRPLAALVVALGQMGGRVAQSDAGGLPLQVDGGGLVGADVTLTGNVSSQFVSGVLIAAAASGQTFDIRVKGMLVQPAYVALSVDYLQRFGARIAVRDARTRWLVSASRLVGQNLRVEADASTACYFWALAAATGGTVTVQNVGSACGQADVGLLEILQRMGCRSQQTDSATTVIGPKNLKGGFEVDLSHMSDQAPTLAALAALADAPIVISGVGHIRHHESDRLAVMAAALRGVGAQVDVYPTGMRVTPKLLHGAQIDPHDDHRIAMAMAILAVKTPGVRILRADCVAKTCPHFFEMLAALGVVIRWRGAPDA